MFIYQVTTVFDNYRFEMYRLLHGIFISHPILARNCCISEVYLVLEITFSNLFKLKNGTRLSFNLKSIIRSSSTFIGLHITAIVRFRIIWYRFLLMFLNGWINPYCTHCVCVMHCTAFKCRLPGVTVV